MRMAAIEELRDSDEGPLLDLLPDLPPHLANNRHQTVDEVVRDLKKSPFFMTSIEDAGDEPNPELDAIKALLYEGSRAEIAENFREQGNEFAREKKWRDGKELYSKGLAALRAQRKDEDPVDTEEDKKEVKLKELLLVNRALCNLELQNYRSCVIDCTECLSLAPHNIKAHYRMASALFRLSKLPEAETTAAAGIQIDGTNNSLLILMGKIKTKRAEQAAIENRRREREERAQKERFALSAALQVRGIKYRKTEGVTAPDLPEDAVMQLEGDKLSPASTLLFPVTVLYPLKMQSDFIKAFRESQTLYQHLEYLLPPPWDEGHEYTGKGVEAYIETIEGGLLKWGKNVELGKLLGGGKVEVLDGIVRVNLVPKARAGEWIDAVRRRKKA